MQIDSELLSEVLLFKLLDENERATLIPLLVWNIIPASSGSGPTWNIRSTSRPSSR